MFLSSKYFPNFLAREKTSDNNKNNKNNKDNKDKIKETKINEKK